MRVAFSSMAWNTGSSSPGELEMTFSTSEVAVCCSSDFGQIVGALAQLVEQPRVLDGDDGLGGEVLHQLDLLVGERPHLLAVDGERADQLVFLEHRHQEEATNPAAASTLEVGAGRFDPRHAGRLQAGVEVSELEPVPSQA